jgi:hypothetical protein
MKNGIQLYSQKLIKRAKKLWVVGLYRFVQKMTSCIVGGRTFRYVHSPLFS